jgi:HK97 family phage major capsid protein
VSLVDPNARVGRSSAPGDAFISSQQYKSIADPASRSSRWSTGKVEIPLGHKSGELFEGTLDSAGTGAPLVPIDTRPGVAPILGQPPTAVDLFATAATASNKVRVVVESVADSGAAVVPEGGEKPQTELEFDEQDIPILKLAHVLTVSDEMLDDAPALSAYMNQRLSLFLRQEEEAQVLGGAGGDNLLGLLPQIPTENKFVVSDADTPTPVDHVFAAITAAERSYLRSDGILINPEDWADIRLTKDDNLNYIGGSPFSTGPGEPSETLWNRRVVVTNSVPVGYGVVGSFGLGATIFRRGGVTVEASNSAGDNFVKNLVTIRCESRLGLAVTRPSSFAIADLGGAS